MGQSSRFSARSITSCLFTAALLAQVPFVFLHKSRGPAQALYWLLCLIRQDLTLGLSPSQAQLWSSQAQTSANKCRTEGSVTLRVMVALYAGLCLVSSSFEFPYRAISWMLLEYMIRVQPVLEMVQEHAGLAAWVWDSIQQTSVKGLALGGFFSKTSVICVFKKPLLSTLMGLFANITWNCKGQQAKMEYRAWRHMCVYVWN